jgi:Protein of unknown function (DUF4242)
MPKFIVERSIAGIGDYSAEKLNDITSRVRTTLKSLGGRMQWLETFITQDKLFTILTAPDEATVQEYSKLANLPIDKIHKVKTVVDYTTGE